MKPGALTGKPGGSALHGKAGEGRRLSRNPSWQNWKQVVRDKRRGGVPVWLIGLRILCCQCTGSRRYCGAGSIPGPGTSALFCMQRGGWPRVLAPLKSRWARLKSLHSFTQSTNISGRLPRFTQRARYLQNSFGQAPALLGPVDLGAERS